MMWPIVGVSQDHRDPSHKVGQIWDYMGYLILTIALDSIYLNPDDDIAIGQVSVFLRPKQATHLSTWSERGPTSRESLSMNPGKMVLIWAPLSKGAMQLSPLTLTLATFSIPYHWLKGSGFKKGVCVWHFMLGCPGTPLPWLPFLEGLRLPSLVPSPVFGLKAYLP